MTASKPTVWTVYAICDPTTGQPFYIGQSKCFARRQRQHLETYRPKSYRSRHVKSLLDAGHEPIFNVLHQTTTHADAIALERIEILRHATRGLLLKQQKAATFIQLRHERARRKAEAGA